MHLQGQRRRLRILVGVLLVDAILGIALTTIIDFEPSKHSVAQNSVLVLHILLAIGIVLGGIIQLVSAVRTGVLRGAAAVGLLSALTALAAGGKSADNGSDAAIFIMATCFIVAVAVYGYSLTQVSVLLATKSKG